MGLEVDASCAGQKAESKKQISSGLGADSNGSPERTKELRRIKT
jgi:hypothetical protein